MIRTNEHLFRWRELTKYVRAEHQRISEAVNLEFNKGRIHQLQEIEMKMAQIEKEKPRED